MKKICPLIIALIGVSCNSTETNITIDKSKYNMCQNSIAYGHLLSFFSKKRPAKELDK